MTRVQFFGHDYDLRDGVIEARNGALLSIRDDVTGEVYERRPFETWTPIDPPRPVLAQRAEFKEAA